MLPGKVNTVEVIGKAGRVIINESDLHLYSSKGYVIAGVPESETAEDYADIAPGFKEPFKIDNSNVYPRISVTDELDLSKSPIPPKELYNMKRPQLKEVIKKYNLPIPVFGTNDYIVSRILEVFSQRPAKG